MFVQQTCQYLENPATTGSPNQISTHTARHNPVSPLSLTRSPLFYEYSARPGWASRTQDTTRWNWLLSVSGRDYLHAKYKCSTGYVNDENTL